MMTFNSRVGAGALVGLAALYLVASLAAGKKVRSEPLPDLTAAEAGLDAWRAAAAMVDGTRAVVVDTRAQEELQFYRAMGTTSLPGAGVGELRNLAKAHGAVVVASAKEEEARELVAKARAQDPQGRYHYLQGGLRAWYMAWELPVALFADAAPPRGYNDALATVRAFLREPAGAATPAVLEAVQEVARMGYVPTGVGGAAKGTAAGKRKKLSGGCGG
jgi:hypothetical protein